MDFDLKNLFSAFKMPGGAGAGSSSSSSSQQQLKRKFTSISPSVSPAPQEAPAQPITETTSETTAPKTSEKSPKKPKEDASSVTTATTTAPAAAAATTTTGKDSKELTGPRTRGCVHEVAIPEGYPVKSEAEELAEEAHLPEGERHGTLEHPTAPRSDRARTWKFTLDPFQETSIACIERRESVLVSAHTSAGKTVVAEYAIALALKKGQRVIYTSPIKALSNQKYRELSEEFKDVGLMTGDITINPNATCLVMTTEILRSMLYRGNEIVREVAWVVFDEIHYLRNKERGVVWEETIILLPDTVRMVFLSATIPNAREFAAWIAATHAQPCHVVYTDMRPVPLQHYLFPAGGAGLHLVVDDKGRFRDDNFQKALAALTDPDAMREAQSQRRRRAQRRGAGTAQDCKDIVNVLIERNFQPVIVFAFSKRETEALALKMAAEVDTTTDREKELIAQIFGSAIGSLSPADQQLPQIQSIRPMLLRGVGVHHGGLLPILKEAVEILFQEGLLKILFATETFAMGLNMPAKTVVFTSVRKFDGGSFRNISAGEYIQMSGRAGRRGLDDRGIVVLMFDEKLEPAQIKNMVWGDADPLNSAFYVSYCMLLNLLRVDLHGAAACDPDSLVARSFRQFQAQRALPRLQARLADLLAERSAIVIPGERDVAEYHYVRANITRLAERERALAMQPVYALPFLQPGRVVYVRDTSGGGGDNNDDDGNDGDWGLGVVVSFQKRPLPLDAITSNKALQLQVAYVVDVLLECKKQSQARSAPTPAPGWKEKELGEERVLPVSLDAIDFISTMRIYMPKELRSREAKQSIARSMRELPVRYPKGVPRLSPSEDMGVEPEALAAINSEREKLEHILATDPRFSSNSDINERYALYTRRLRIDDDARELRRAISDASRMAVLGAELKAMKRVLRRLGYTSQDDVIETKGRVAAELNAGDEIVLTELMFSGLFNDMTPENIAALLSCFVVEERSSSSSASKDGTGERLPPQKELVEAYRQVQETACRVANVWKECKIEVNVEDYVQKFSPAIMEAIGAWCAGATFAEVMKITDTFEGSLIRMMRRLEELLKELVSAAKSIGNSELEAKFGLAISKLHKDIVFAASLYL